jgi:hypothetical protein
MSAETWTTVRRLGLGLREVKMLLQIARHEASTWEVFPIPRGDHETADACDVLTAALLATRPWSMENDCDGCRLTLDGTRLAGMVLAQPAVEASNAGAASPRPMDEVIADGLVDPRGDVEVHGYPVSPEARTLLRVSNPATVVSGIRERFDYAHRVHRAALRAEERHGPGIMDRLVKASRMTGFFTDYQRACEGA